MHTIEYTLDLLEFKESQSLIRRLMLNIMDSDSLPFGSKIDVVVSRTMVDRLVLITIHSFSHNITRFHIPIL
jgi:hypothetical protein